MGIDHLIPIGIFSIFIWLWYGKKMEERKNVHWYTRPMTSSGRFHTRPVSTPLYLRLLTPVWRVTPTGVVIRRYTKISFAKRKTYLITKGTKHFLVNLIHPTASTYPLGKPTVVCKNMKNGAGWIIYQLSTRNILHDVFSSFVELFKRIRMTNNGFANLQQNFLL